MLNFNKVVTEIEIRDEDFYLGLDQFARFIQISRIYIPRIGIGLRMPTLEKQRKIFRLSILTSMIQG